MPTRKLTNIQWQLMRQSLWVGLIAVSMSALLFFLLWDMTENFTSLQGWLWTQWGWRVPPFPGWIFVGLTVCTFWFVAAVVGAGIGYVAGNLFKKRLEILLQSTMRLERGQLATRIPFLGDDEIGALGKRLNTMTARVQEQVASLQRLSTHNAELTEQVKQTAILEERQRLARELHDAVSQQLFAISMTMAALKRTLEHHPEKAGQQAQMVEDMAVAAQSEMRALLLHLRPTHLEGKTLQQGVDELLTELETKHPLSFTWRIDALPDLPKGIEDHLFRILQEALSNALRHAQAAHVEVKVSAIRGHIRLRVTDDGIGFSGEAEAKSSSYGMTLMRERVVEIGGVLDVSSAPEQGTMIEVTVPLVAN